jgi:hypothetical protein
MKDELKRRGAARRYSSSEPILEVAHLTIPFLYFLFFLNSGVVNINWQKSKHGKQPCK